MHSLARTPRWLALALLVTLAGCFKLARTSPQLTQYVLGGLPSDPADVSTANAESFTVGVRRLQLASYLSTPSIVVRRGPHQIATSEFHRWGEELGAGINRAIAAELARHPSIPGATVAPWPSRSMHDLVLQVHMQRFEGMLDSVASSGRVHVVATWDVIRPRDDSVLVRGIAEIRDGRWNAGDYTALVGALDAALAQVARLIGACLADIHAGRPTSSSCTGAAPTARIPLSFRDVPDP